MENSNSNNSFIHNVRLDKQFTTLPNATFADERISWGAKGLLVYMLTREEGWKVHTWQLANIYKGEARGNGLDSVKSYMKELKAAGYIQYQKFQNAEGQWQHNYYVYPLPFDKFQKMFPEVVQPPMVQPPMVQPSILPNTELPNTELNNNNPPTPQKGAAVVSSKNEFTEEALRAQRPKAQIPPKAKAAPPPLADPPQIKQTIIYDCLKNLDIPEADKAWISKTHTIGDVERAIAWATHPLTRIEKTLQQAIKWACKSKPEIPSDKQDVTAKNKQTAETLEKSVKNSNKAVSFKTYSSYCEIEHGGINPAIVISYNENGFKDQLLNNLRKYGFTGIP